MANETIDRGVIRQWEARVRRMVIHGESRESILIALGDANWPFDQADQLLRRVATRERWKAIAIVAGCGALAAFGILVTFVSLTSTTGGVVYVPIAGIVGFIYGLVRLIRIRV